MKGCNFRYKEGDTAIWVSAKATSPVDILAQLRRERVSSGRLSVEYLYSVRESKHPRDDSEYVYRIVKVGDVYKDWDHADDLIGAQAVQYIEPGRAAGSHAAEDARSVWEIRKELAFREGDRVWVGQQPRVLAGTVTALLRMRKAVLDDRTGEDTEDVEYGYEICTEAGLIIADPEEVFDSNEKASAYRYTLLEGFKNYFPEGSTVYFCNTLPGLETQRCIKGRVCGIHLCSRAGMLPWESSYLVYDIQIRGTGTPADGMQLPRYHGCFLSGDAKSAITKSLEIYMSEIEDNMPEVAYHTVHALRELHKTCCEAADREKNKGDKE